MTTIVPTGTGGFLHPEKVLRELDIKPGMRVADFGCGAGYFSILLGKIVGEQGKIAALDVMETALQSVRTKAQLEKVINIETIRANLEILGGSKLSDNSQDLVLLANILFQSNKKMEIIKEATRVVKSNGKVVIIDWNPSSLIGPTADLKTPPAKIKEIANSLGLKLEKEFSAGDYHYGLIFRK